MDIAPALNSDDRSKVMHEDNNMSPAIMNTAAVFNPDDILPPDSEESSSNDEGEDMDDDDNNVPSAVVKSDNILPPEWESDSESEIELLDEDLLRPSHCPGAGVE
jgi:hypothetical protein